MTPNDWVMVYHADRIKTILSELKERPDDPELRDALEVRSRYLSNAVLRMHPHWMPWEEMKHLLGDTK